MQFNVLRKPLLRLFIKIIENLSDSQESFLIILVFKVFRENPQIKFHLNQLNPISKSIKTRKLLR